MEGTSIDEKKGAQASNPIAVTLTQVRGRGRAMAWGNPIHGQMETEMKTEIHDSCWV